MKRTPMILLTSIAFTLTGGTGKFSRIEGGGEYSTTNLPPASEGTFRGYSKLTNQWKIP